MADVTTDPYAMYYDVDAPDTYTLRGRSRDGSEGLFTPSRCWWTADNDQGELRAIASGYGTGPKHRRLYFRTWGATPPRWFPPIPGQLTEFTPECLDGYPSTVVVEP